jgi:TPR repeat protein
MGRVYGPIEYGTVAIQSWQKSEFWLRKSAEGGSRRGTYYYARYLDEKKNDQAAAARWYLHAAKNGVLGAQREMANRYNSGNGVPKDPDQVGYWLTQLAEQTTHPGMRKWARRQLGYR